MGQSVCAEPIRPGPSSFDGGPFKVEASSSAPSAPPRQRQSRSRGVGQQQDVTQQIPMGWMQTPAQKQVPVGWVQATAQLDPFQSDYPEENVVLSRDEVLSKSDAVATTAYVALESLWTQMGLSLDAKLAWWVGRGRSLDDPNIQMLTGALAARDSTLLRRQLQSFSDDDVHELCKEADELCSMEEGHIVLRALNDSIRRADADDMELWLDEATRLNLSVLPQRRYYEHLRRTLHGLASEAGPQHFPGSAAGGEPMSPNNTSFASPNGTEDVQTGTHDVGPGGFGASQEQDLPPFDTEIPNSDEESTGAEALWEQLELAMTWQDTQAALEVIALLESMGELDSETAAELRTEAQQPGGGQRSPRPHRDPSPPEYDTRPQSENQFRPARNEPGPPQQRIPRRSWAADRGDFPVPDVTVPETAPSRPSGSVPDSTVPETAPSRLSGGRFSARVPPGPLRRPVPAKEPVRPHPKPARDTWSGSHRPASSPPPAASSSASSGVKYRYERAPAAYGSQADQQPAVGQQSRSGGARGESVWKRQIRLQAARRLRSAQHKRGPAAAAAAAGESDSAAAYDAFARPASQSAEGTTTSQSTTWQTRYNTGTASQDVKPPRFGTSNPTAAGSSRAAAAAAAAAAGEQQKTSATATKTASGRQPSSYSGGAFVPPWDPHVVGDEAPARGGAFAKAAAHATTESPFGGAAGAGHTWRGGDGPSAAQKRRSAASVPPRSSFSSANTRNTGQEPRPPSSPKQPQGAQQPPQQPPPQAPPRQEHASPPPPPPQQEQRQNQVPPKQPPPRSHRSAGRSSTGGTNSSSGERNAMELLGLQPGFSPEELRSAYKKAAMQWHPDRPAWRAAGEAEMKRATEMFQKVKDAYDYLSGKPSRPG